MTEVKLTMLFNYKYLCVSQQSEIRSCTELSKGCFISVWTASTDLGNQGSEGERDYLWHLTNKQA